MSGGQPGIAYDCRENKAAGIQGQAGIQAMKMVRNMRLIASGPGTVALAAEVLAGITGGCGHAMLRNEQRIGLTDANSN